MQDKTRKLLSVILVVIAVLCAGYLIWYYGSALKARKSQDAAKDIAKKEEAPVVKEETEEPDESVEIPIDFASLQETNPDVYAWIQIDGTSIDYPVLQSAEDDSYYLNHSWEGKSAPEGAIFSQACNAKDFTDFNTVLYGHQMGDKVETMFHQLGNYLDADFMQSHRDIVIYTPENIRTYRVFAAVIYDDRHLVQHYNYVMDSERQDFIDSIYNSRDLRNQFCDDVEVTTQSRILSLSTCIAAEPSHRLLVEAVLVDEK